MKASRSRNLKPKDRLIGGCFTVLHRLVLRTVEKKLRVH